MRLEQLPDAVRAAETRIRNLVRQTRVERSSVLESLHHGQVFLKLENLQHTGSFKLRGAANRILSMSEESRQRGVVAASSGNHGMAVAHASARVGCPAVVYVPEHASPKKISAMRKLGTQVRIGGDDCLVSEASARAFAKAEGKTYISPYNDALVLAGQGTVGLELSRQIEPLDALFVAVGGGGLISGIAGFLRNVWPDMRVIACSPENSPVLHASLKAGEILDLESTTTLSDGTAGGMEADSITFGLCQQTIDESILVSEQEIRDAWRLIASHHSWVMEGAAAVAIAAFLSAKERHEGKRVGIVICGGNVADAVLADVLA